MDIHLHDKTFTPYLSQQTLEKAVQKLAQTIAKDHKNETPIFIGILNGSFMFCADLLKQYPHSCEISFIKVASYQKTNSTGIVNELIGLNEDIKNRTIIILEDIVDTGTTLEKIMPMLQKNEPKAIKIATLFLKPTVYNKPIPVDYIGLEIPNNFIVGYGLDYDGLGRNLTEVYKLKES